MCSDLWERARGLLRAPEDALFAWSLLKEWVDGFIKNSRNRVKGKSIFACKKEREEYEDLNVIMTNVSQIPSLDDSFTDWDSDDVSILSFQ